MSKGADTIKGYLGICTTFVQIQQQEFKKQELNKERYGCGDIVHVDTQARG